VRAGGERLGDDGVYEEMEGGDDGKMGQDGGEEGDNGE